MRGINKVVVSGNVAGDINFSTLRTDEEALSFSLASDRRGNGHMITAWIKINVYISQLVNVCRSRLVKGGYIIVEGELMNRDGQHGRLTEVRAKEIIFIPMGG